MLKGQFNLKENKLSEEGEIEAAGTWNESGLTVEQEHKL